MEYENKCNNQFCPMKNGEVSNKCKFEDCPYRTNEKPKAEELAMFLMKKVFEGNNGKKNNRR